MSGRKRTNGNDETQLGNPVRYLDPWLIVPMAVGIVFAWIQTLHIFEMVYYGTVGVVLEAVLPLVLAMTIAATGPWLYRRGYTRTERRRVVSWMALGALLVGLLFVWALSHQFILNYRFPHAQYVSTTNLIGGSLLGLVVGIYDTRTRRHRRAVEEERETVLQQRARLSVLNRVLRHNIRNEAAVVMGITESLAEQTGGEIAEMAETAATKTGELVDLGEKARQIEQATNIDDEALTEVELRATVETVIETFEPVDTEVQFMIDIPEDMRLLTSARMLYRLLDELVENALEHGNVSPLRISISATMVEEDTIEISVADNGVGLPAHEQEVLTENVETALDHGSGLGLWLVNWGVATLGGELTFQESEWGGTAVHVRLPRNGPHSTR